MCYIYMYSDVIMCNNINKKDNEGGHLMCSVEVVFIRILPTYDTYVSLESTQMCVQVSYSLESNNYKQHCMLLFPISRLLIIASEIGY